MAKKSVAPSSNIPNREELFNMAVNAAKQGQRNGAKVMFSQVLDQDPNNIKAMMWMAKIASSNTERRKWLDKVLAIKPNYAPAQQIMDKMAHEGNANRNRQLLRVGVIAYVAVVLIISLLMMISSATAPIV
jgi:Tfp pilus assembly protein PilF